MGWNQAQSKCELTITNQAIREARVAEELFNELLLGLFGLSISLKKGSLLLSVRDLLTWKEWPIERNLQTVTGLWYDNSLSFSDM